jgi:hypothetical protein
MLLDSFSSPFDVRQSARQGSAGDLGRSSAGELTIMPSRPPIAPAGMTQDFVLSKCGYFVDVQLWPVATKMDPGRWLSNFTSDEQAHATQLLNAFLYFSSGLLDQILVAAFQTLSRVVTTTSDPFLTAQATWRSFCDRLVVTYVTGEKPSPTDSGYLFARKARQLLGVPEQRILSPERAAAELHLRGLLPVVFVDDFVGSGDQFVTTWKRTFKWPSGSGSFENLQKVKGGQFYYCPLICTEVGMSRIQSDCPGVSVRPGHLLSTKYSAVAADSILWPDALRSTAREMIHEASKRAGIPDHDCEGYKGLGLALAFEHSVPDATLPLFYWSENGWYPLVRRT